METFSFAFIIFEKVACMTIVWIILLLAVAFIMWRRLQERKHKQGASVVTIHKSAPTKGETRPVVLVRGNSLANLQHVLKSFCALYNAERQQARIKILTINEEAWLLTFPNGIDFEIFCYLINYLVYPIEGHSLPNVTGWARDPVSTLDAMYYIPHDDDEHDNVYTTLADNRCYKIDFSFKQDRKALPAKRVFESFPIQLKEINNATEMEIC